jgi:hypothetical protein
MVSDNILRSRGEALLKDMKTHTDPKPGLKGTRRLVSSLGTNSFVSGIATITGSKLTI